VAVLDQIDAKAVAIFREVRFHSGADVDETQLVGEDVIDQMA
jgi:hypothetical protein